MRSNSHIVAWILMTGLLRTATAAEPPVPLWTIEDRIAAPSHALYDAETKHIYISQISGEGDKKDGVGVISRISLAGRMRDSDWAARLDAPKGMARSGKTLWVSDIDQLHEIDIESGDVKESHDIDGAKFLTGVTADSEGCVYLADMLTSTIFTFRNGKAAVHLRGKALESPAGILAAEKRLIVAAWGFTTDYSTDVPGCFYLLENDKPRPLSKPVGNLYGLVSDGGKGWIGSDFATGRILHVTERSEPRELLRLGKGIGGIEYIPAKNMLIVCELTENRVSAFDLATVLQLESK